AIVNAPDVGLAANFEKANVLSETGKVFEAEALYNKIVEDFLAGRKPPTRDLIYVAGALEATGHAVDAGDVYTTIVKADPKNVEAWIAWGDLFSRKFKESYAIENYREAQKTDPNNPFAHFGLAKNLADSDPEKTEVELKALIEVNPRMPELHLTNAVKAIESEEYGKVMESVNKALAVN